MGVDSTSHSGDPIDLTKSKDFYGYEKYAESLAETLLDCKTPFVAGIYGRWGRGKSTFLTTLRSQIAAKSTAKPLAFDYSPWQYNLQSFNDVWISMLCEFALGDARISTSLKAIADKVSLRRTFREAATGLASKFFGEKAGKNVAKGVVGEEQDAAVSSEYSDFLDAKKNFEKALKHFREQNPKSRIFIYIDDIDRCEPKTSVEVLRAIQLLCRTEGCVLVLGIDRDVVVHNLTKIYEDGSYAREYLDKIVQLHIELPVLDAAHVETTILERGKGEARAGVEPFVDWIAGVLDFNPRKLERFAYLYDYREMLRKKLNTPADFQTYRQNVMFTVWDLRWPELATTIRRSREVLDALEQLREAKTKSATRAVRSKYRRIESLPEILKHGQFMHAFEEIYKIKDPSAKK